jgi:hypothetical protein
MSDWSIWYLIGLFGFICLALAIWTAKETVANPTVFYSRHVRYPLICPSWMTITRLQGLVLSMLFASNIIVILAPSFFPGWRELQRRAALAAIVNLAPLCLGGRAPIIDALNLPRHWYRLIHYTLGLIMALECIVHVVTALALHPRSGTITTFGWAVSTCYSRRSYLEAYLFIDVRLSSRGITPIAPLIKAVFW